MKIFETENKRDDTFSIIYIRKEELIHPNEFHWMELGFHQRSKCAAKKPDST